MSNSRSLRILAIPGSLRRESHNKSLLRAAVGLAPHHVELHVYEHLGEVPLFNEDLEGEPQQIAGVSRLREQVTAADGILIATPEYNQSVPGVVKNMIDWLSRSEPEEGLAGKPVAVMGATTGPWGTRISQTILRQMLHSTHSLVMPAPTLYVSHAADRFDANGELVDVKLAARVGEFLIAFEHWIRSVSLAVSA